MSRALPYTTVPARSYDDEQLQALHDSMREADGVWRAALAHSAPHGLVRDLCEDYVQAAYRFQRKRWGRVRCRMRVCDLMR